MRVCADDGAAGWLAGWLAFSVERRKSGTIAVCWSSVAATPWRCECVHGSDLARTLNLGQARPRHFFVFLLPACVGVVLCVVRPVNMYEFFCFWVCLAASFVSAREWQAVLFPRVMVPCFV